MASAGLGQARGPARHHRLRGARHRRQGRNDQGDHRAGQSAGVSRGRAPAPSERQKTQMFAQRYIEQFPAAGKVVIFDRSWYNRAGVDRVMDFIDERQPAFCEIGLGGATQSGPEACAQRCTVVVMTAPRVGCDHHLSSRSINGLRCGRFGVSSRRRLSRRIRSVSQSRMMCSASGRTTCLSRSPRS